MRPKPLIRARGRFGGFSAIVVLVKERNFQSVFAVRSSGSLAEVELEYANEERLRCGEKLLVFLFFCFFMSFHFQFRFLFHLVSLDSLHAQISHFNCVALPRARPARHRNASPRAAPEEAPTISCRPVQQATKKSEPPAWMARSSVDIIPDAGIHHQAEQRRAAPRRPERPLSPSSSAPSGAAPPLRRRRARRRPRRRGRAHHPLPDARGARVLLLTHIGRPKERRKGPGTDD